MIVTGQSRIAEILTEQYQNKLTIACRQTTFTCITIKLDVPTNLRKIRDHSWNKNSKFLFNYVDSMFYYFKKDEFLNEHSGDYYLLVDDDNSEFETICETNVVLE